MEHPILEVDLVLVQTTGDLVQFGCMVRCPGCGTVNEHGLGVDTLGNWGHRVCKGWHFGHHCDGYVLAPASVICRTDPKEWRRRTQPLLRVQRRHLKELLRRDTNDMQRDRRAALLRARA